MRRRSPCGRHSPNSCRHLRPAAAGHSLGEYSALAAAGVLDYWDGLKLVAARGTAMASAAAANPSSMAALLGADAATAERIAAERRADDGQLWVANLNAPGQVVLAGAVDDIAWLVASARNLGVRRAIELNVAGGFHSPLMAGAATDLRDALGDVEIGGSELSRLLERDRGAG